MSLACAVAIVKGNSHAEGAKPGLIRRRLKSVRIQLEFKVYTQHRSGVSEKFWCNFWIF